MIGQAIRDLRHASRMILRMPALAAVVIGSLGVGIGANTIVFSWIQSVVLNPIAGAPRASGFHLIEAKSDAGMYVGSSWLEYRDLRERLRAVDGPIAFHMIPLYVGERGRVERSSALLVSDNYFSSLGLTPALGRFLRADEVDKPGTAPVVVISYDYWQTRFNGAAGALGQSIRVNGIDVAIVGVAPRGFRGTVMQLVFDFWLPATLAPSLIPGSKELDDRNIRTYTVTGPLAAGATRAQAQSDVDVVMRQLAQAYPPSNRNVQAEVLPFWQSPRGPQRLMATSLAILQLLMLLLLLAVCGNTANLVLARASARQREMGVRLALGAGPWRVASLLLMENVLLALLGAALGGAIALWGTTTLSAMPPLRVRGIPISFETHVDATSFAFTLALGLACGLIFGLAPALQLARLDPQLTLRAGASTAPRSRLRNTLMAVEVALAVVVLLAAGIFLRSFMQTRNEDTGFKRDGVLLAAYDLSGRNIAEAPLKSFTATLLERVRALPGIESAALATSVPLDIHGMPMRFFELEGRPRTDATAGRGAGQQRDARLLRRHGAADPRRPGLRRSARPGRAAAGRRQRGVRPPLPGRRRSAGTPGGDARPHVRDRRRGAELALQRVRRAADADSVLLAARPSLGVDRDAPARASRGPRPPSRPISVRSSGRSIPSCRSTTSAPCRITSRRT